MYIREYVEELYRDPRWKTNEKKVRDVVRASYSLSHDYVIPIIALTGGPSAAKTMQVIEDYPDATFITPTKKLKSNYVNKAMTCFTRHEALQHIEMAETVVIDEISQIELEYVAIIHLLNPKCRIICVGDVHQIPFVPYGKINYNHIKSVGVQNNLQELKAVPLDICNMINRKYKLNYTTTSDVKHGLCISKSPLEKFKKVPIICFNDATAKTLISQGFNCNTITTYQGSREPVVVFYIDSAAVQSSIANKVEWIYTAMTRATNQLVLS